MSHLNAANSWKAIKHLADVRRIRQYENKVLLLLTLLIGAIVGLLVVAFIVVTENLGSRMYPPGGAAWRRVAIPIFGALITGFFLSRYFQNARGSGIPQTKTALFLQSGVIRLRTVVGKFLCSSISLASGIALGREGPSVQVGAGIASVLGRQLGLSPANIRALVPIGASAALAAAFNTPIAAVLFTLEEVMGDLHARVLGAIVLSSATSWMVLHLLLGDEPLFHVPAYQLVHPLEFAFYAVLGIAGGLVSVCFVKLLLWLRKHFLRMPARTEWFQPAFGGMVVGLFGWVVPDVLGVGYSHVSQALNGQLVLKTMVLLVALKVVATASCYASGNAGGIFGPSLFIGAMIGGAVGGGAHLLLPDYTGSVGAYALVGMGAAFAGIIRVPMTSVIMIFEVTRDYSIIVPLMIANLISYFISSRLQPEPIYEALLHQDNIHLPAGAKDREDLVTVRYGVHRPAVVLQAAAAAGQTLGHRPATENVWPVVGAEGFMGMITRSRLEEAVKEGRQDNSLGELLPDVDLSVDPPAEEFPHVHLDHPIDTAMRRMAHTGLNLLPVVSRSNLRDLLGVISWEDSLDAYKVEDSAEAAEPQQGEKRTRVAVLGGILVVLILMIFMAVFLSYYYQVQRTARAQEFYHQGNTLMEEARYPEAIERFRSALSISHLGRDRLALAMALLKAGRWNEAAIYLQELIRENPNSGAANLGMARIAAQEGNVREAENYYHLAIYGNWQETPLEHRIEARIELVRTLGRFGRRSQAQAELLSLAAELPESDPARMQVGQLLLDYSLPQDAADVFETILKTNSQDAAALAALGRADFALEDFTGALAAYEKAARLNPSDMDSKQRSEVITRFLDMNPLRKGLSAAERYDRSRRLMEATLGALDQCLAGLTNPAPQSADDAAIEARKALERRTRPRSSSEATAANLALAVRLWDARTDLCGPPPASDQAIQMIMSRLPRDAGN